MNGGLNKPDAAGDGRGRVTIGLVNNAADRARKTVERQFRGLLGGASSGIDVTWRLFRRSERDPSAEIDGSGYQSIDEMFVTPLDAVIVTGMEPTARRLQDEPVWHDIGRIADWARDLGVPVMWSCLAAHAAVLHLDGVERRRLAKKLSGLYDCGLVAREHPLCEDFPPRWQVPHSRLNDLDEDALRASGYQILSRTDSHGVDLFVKPGRARFLFSQGHPEYETGSLGAEYERDVRRYVLGQRSDHPDVPVSYFDSSVQAALETLRDDVMRGPERSMVLGEVVRVLRSGDCANSWQKQAQRLYGNWLRSITTGDPDPPRAVRTSLDPSAFERETITSAPELVQ